MYIEYTIRDDIRNHKNMKIDWLSLFYGKKFQAFINSQAAHKFSGDIARQEEAVSYLIEKLSENDWAMCQKHNGLSSPEGYLKTLSANLMVEYGRKVFGRKRPPEWLKREGSFWEQIWNDLCLKREGAEFIIDKACKNGEREPSSIKNIIRTIKVKIPWCGVSNRPESIDDDEYGADSYVYENDSFDGNGIDEHYKKNNYNQILSLVQLILTGNEESEQNTITALDKDIVSAVHAIQLSAEERLMLRMHYIDGYSHSAIARRLDVAKHIPVRQNKKTLERLLAILNSLGLDFEPIG